MNYNKKTRALIKETMIKALEGSLGIVTSAVATVNTALGSKLRKPFARQTHYVWLNDDPSYKQAVDDVANVALDFAETSLMTQI
jgi:hypothetical protein